MDPKLRHAVFCEWLGRPLESTEDLTPVSLRETFQKALKSIGLADRFQESTLLERWHELVSPTLAPHCSPGAIRRGVLIVNVDHPAWLHQITFAHKTHILKTIQSQFPHLKVKDLHLRISAG